MWSNQRYKNKFLEITYAFIVSNRHKKKQFSDLPAELRLKIWVLLVPEPRVVPIRYLHATMTYVARMSPPALLQINRESRHEAFKIYHELHLGPKKIDGCYVDFKRDALYMSSDLNGSDFIPPSLKVQESFEQRFEMYNWKGPTKTNYPMTCIGYTPAIPSRHAHVIIEDLVHMPDGDRLTYCLRVNYRMWDFFEPFLRAAKYREMEPRPRPLNRIRPMYEPPDNRWRADGQVKVSRWETDYYDYYDSYLMRIIPL